MSVTYLGTPDKSENDKKEYRCIRLSNGLTILLISDPSPKPESELSDSFDSEEESSIEEISIASTSTESESSDEDYESDDEGDERLAACALMVDVGSFSDPRDVQGLSHFLEHMIFMGSNKYPAENAFDSHIKKCGGFDNADTECEETNFYFEVPDEHLESSIERFVSLFEEPLMKKEAMTREREAVESEFQESLQDDEQRRNQILGSELGNPNHPSSIFCWGNSKTLKETINDDSLYEKLHKHRKQHYSAHRMYACLQARMTLDELEVLAVKHFSKIPNNANPSDDFSLFNHSNCFKSEFYDNVIFVKPVSNIIKIDLTWCLPTLVKEYRTKPHHYLSYLFGHEGKGSLCAYLRKKLWALELISGIDDAGFEYNSMYSLFNVCIYLTEKGFQHIDEVLSAAFSYIKLLEHADGHAELYEELRYIEEVDFRFETERCAFDNVQDHVVNMKYYPVKDILTGSNLYFEFNENSIRKMIDYITKGKFNLMITSYIKYDEINYDKIEKWFGTEYASVEMPQKWKRLLRDAKCISDLHFPQNNEFISTDFKIFWKESGQTPIPQYPKKIVDSETSELWFRQDDKFFLPEAYMYFNFITPLAFESNKSAVLLTLYSHIIKFQLIEKLYPATIAGLSYQFYSSDKGIVLKVNGYNEKLHLIVDLITTTMKDIDVNDEQLEVYKKNLQKQYYNSLMKPKNLNKDIRLKILENIRWPMYEKYNVLKDITLNDVKDFSLSFCKELKIQAIMQGNLNEETALNVMNSVMTKLNCDIIKNTEIVRPRTRKLPLGTNSVICSSINADDSNTVITNYYQIGASSIKLQCLLDLLLMTVEEPLFDILRTKEQLGYDVSATVRNNFGILGYSITINSQENKYEGSFVQNRIEAFRQKMMQILRDMTIDEFEHIKESLVKTKQVSDLELKDEISRNWSEITSEEYMFDRLRREIEFLRTINKDDLIEFCLDYEKNDFRKLSVQVIGNAKSVEVEKEQNNTIDNSEPDPSKDFIELEILNNEFSTIFSIEEFKGKLELFPNSKTIKDLMNLIDTKEKQ